MQKTQLIQSDCVLLKNSIKIGLFFKPAKMREEKKKKHP